MDRAVSAISASALLCLFLVISRLLHVSGNAEGMAQSSGSITYACKIVRLKFSVRIEKSHISCIVDAIFNGASAVLSVNATWIAFMGFLRSEIDF
ncbi:hypothetical protein ACSBR2_015076 [Camellia fascicularis]